MLVQWPPFHPQELLYNILSSRNILLFRPKLFPSILQVPLQVSLPQEVPDCPGKGHIPSSHFSLTKYLVPFFPSIYHKCQIHIFICLLSVFPTHPHTHTTVSWRTRIIFFLNNTYPVPGWGPITKYLYIKNMLSKKICVWCYPFFYTTMPSCLPSLKR